MIEDEVVDHMADEVQKEEPAVYSGTQTVSA